MKYRNVKTGVEVDVNCELGGAWEPVKAPAAGGTKRGRKSKEESNEPAKDEKK